MVWSATEIAAARNGDLAIAGSMLANGSIRLGIWNGTTLQSIGSQVPLGFASSRLHYVSNGDLFAGKASGGPGHVHRWDGSQWSQIGGFPDMATVDIHELASREILVGGGGNANPLSL